MRSRDISAHDPGQQSRPDSSPPNYCHRSIGRSPAERVLAGDNIRIEWPWTKDGRARKIISRSGARRRYVVPCFRGGDREAHCEAAEERDVAILLDACAGVEFQEQPAKIIFQWRDEEIEHFPDYVVVTEQGKEFWECKRDREVLDLVIRRRTERLADLLRPLGFGYRLVSTQQLLAGHYVENAIRMRRHAKVPVPEPIRCRCDDLTKHPSSKASEILSEITTKGDLDQLSVLFACLYQGVLLGNLHDRISMDMTVSPSGAGRIRPWVWQLFEQTS